MMKLARPIFFGALASILCLGVVFVVLNRTRRTIDDDVVGSETLAAADQLWQLTLTEQADQVRAMVAGALASSNGNAANQSAALADLSRQGVRALVIYDELGQASLTWPSATQAPPVEVLRVSQIVTAHQGFQTVRFADGGALLDVGGPLPAPAPGQAAFIASVSATPLLARMIAAAGGGAFLLDGNRRLAASVGGIDWQPFAQALAGRHSDLFYLSLDQASWRLTVLPLRTTEQGVAGYMVLARDVTRQSHLLDVVDSLSIAAVVVLCFLLGLSLQWIVARSFGPLGSAVTAMSALADGDTGIEVLGGGRPGEIGIMARSIQIFRDQIRRLNAAEDRRLRQWTRQQEFIRVQMMQLADALPEEGRNAFVADLSRIERVTGGQEGGEGASRSLAVIFEVMAGRVLDQYRKLEELVRELKAALGTRDELVQLQQQVELARRMQETMLPGDFRPPPEIEVAGALLSAEGFDGGFYDYLTLEDGRVAIIIGQPADGGFASGFVSAAARTSLRVLLLAELSPGDCLQRTAALLAKEAAAKGYALAALLLDPTARTATWAAAGIDAPFLIRRLGDAVDMPLESAPPLDGTGDRVFADQTVPVPHRATLLVCSPGMLSAMDAAGTGLGRDRAAILLREADDVSAKGVVDTLRKGALAHSRGRPGERDRMCVAARIGS